MSRTELAIVSVFLVVACPFTFFVFVWWTSALLPIPEKAVPGCAFAGLGLGIVVVISRLRSWVSGFYDARKVVAVPLYLFWSAIALAFFMGLPIGVVVLGLIPGLYIGRKEHHACRQADLFKKDARTVSLFTAAITGFVSLAMGIMAVGEQRSMQHILAIVGMSRLAATPGGRIVFVAIAVAVLTTLQYWLTRRTASWGFRLGTDAA